MNTLSPLPDIQHRSNDDAGKLLLAWWVGFQAERAGIAASEMQSKSEISQQIAERIIAATQLLDTDELRNIGLAKALSLSAKGEWSRAGALLREIINTGAWEINLKAVADTGKAYLQRQKHAGRKGGEVRREASASERKKWQEVGKELRQRHPEKSNFWLAGEIGKQVGRPQRTIYNALPGLDLAQKADREPTIR